METSPPPTGDCMEVMATSDNVVRAGLTPKFKDVDTLVEMLTYGARAPTVLTGEVVDGCTRSYPAPVPEFVLQCTTLPADDSVGEYTLPPIPSGAVIMVVAGAAVATVRPPGPLGHANEAGEGLVAPKPLGWTDSAGSTAPPPVALPPGSARGTPGARGGISTLGTNGPASGQLSARGTPRAADAGRTGVIGSGGAAAGAGTTTPTPPASPAASGGKPGTAAAVVSQELVEGTVWFQPAGCTVTLTVRGGGAGGGGGGSGCVLYRTHANVSGVADGGGKEE